MKSNGQPRHVRPALLQLRDYAARQASGAVPVLIAPYLSAEAASVSLGHVSNVRSCLLDREWAQVSRDGLLLSDPDALLDAWREAYELPAGKRHGFYTTLCMGTAFESAVRELGPVSDAGSTALASFSAGQWLAPYGRTGTQYF